MPNRQAAQHPMPVPPARRDTMAMVNHATQTRQRAEALFQQAARLRRMTVGLTPPAPGRPGTGPA